MKLEERLLHAALPLARGKLVERAIIGLGYTAVELSDRRVGVAYTLFEPGCCAYLPPEISFRQRPADLILKGLISPQSLEGSVALAVANALFNSRDLPFLKGDPLELIRPGPEDEVAMIGFFEPLVKRLSGRVGHLWVFERGDHLGPGLLPETEMPVFLPRATLILITSVTILNRTLEDILAQVQRAREVVLLGPSTPMAPEVFEDTPVSLLSGIRVRDPEGVLQAVAEAKGFPGLKPYVEKINLRV
ncbi:DUF364 domain-containing protein [Thermosulfurimonas sp.]|uniref:DUF364 domain-containing protein n=1 Tax=Thermosulfurimonas sp. TaxID=2080236 RepID=UPI0025DEEBB4|nr:DUF364 domain-containing protein [Thermosulfurimonas sp.]